MTRPQMIRADTIDLQDHQSPSAQDHSRQSKQPTPEGAPRHAPHHDQSMRHAEQGALDELARGPVSPQGQRDDHDDHFGGYSDHDGLVEDTAGSRNGGTKLSTTSGEENTEDDTLGDSDGDDQFDDDFMDRISSSPSIDDEDIDFEFVYALHTFVATVEGQANASKGDTMVLLDDSNSYWWLVRVVKDGSIGYLPAEHIETPTERLARLNKHRNVDLSATMLGDNAEKSKNPLKKAMRRRNAKNVSFAAPTYFDAPEVDYSTEEEDEDDHLFDEEEEVTGADSRNVHDDMSDDGDIIVEPLRPKQHQQPQQDQQDQPQQQQQRHIRSVMESPSEDDDLSELATAQNDGKAHGTNQEQPVHGRSRNGTVRNTDSFFKDDSVETKKISLTPNLLRDDANNTVSHEPKDGKVRGSFESFDKAVQSGEKGKDDKKRKDKKHGMLSGLFKRKDRKSKVIDDDTDESEKISGESNRSYTPPKSSSESLKDDSRTTSSKSQIGLQRTPSKLQKAPPPELSPVKETETDEYAVSAPEMDHKSSSRLVAGGGQNQSETLQSPSTENGQSMPQDQSGEQRDLQQSLDAATPVTITSQSDSSSNLSEYDDRWMGLDNKGEPSVTPLASESQPESHSDGWTAGGQVTDVSTATPKEEQRESPQLLSPSSPEFLVTHEPKLGDKLEQQQQQQSPTGAAWNDASLRAYLEDGSDIRDLLVIIHDKSNVAPTSADHPITGSLFKEENRILGEMSSRLDDMLNSWLTRKGLAYVR